MHREHIKHTYLVTDVAAVALKPNGGPQVNLKEGESAQVQ
jgi:hypothetical protein